jgi:hypothetical protein
MTDALRSQAQKCDLKTAAILATWTTTSTYNPHYACVKLAEPRSVLHIDPSGGGVDNAHHGALRACPRQLQPQIIHRELLDTKIPTNHNSDTNTKCKISTFS